MTIDEEKSIIGGVVIEHDQVKKRLAALRAECFNMAQALKNVTTVLTNPLNTQFDPHAQLTTYLDKMPSPGRIRDIASEVKEGEKRRLELEHIMADYGLDVLSSK